MTRNSNIIKGILAALMAAWIAFSWTAIKERTMYRRLMESMLQTGTVLIEMDQKTGTISWSSAGGSALFGRDIVGLNVHEIMPPEYRAAHDAAIERVNKCISDGSFKPRVIYRQAFIKTASGKRAVNLRVHATCESVCYAMVDPMETKQ